MHPRKVIGGSRRVAVGATLGAVVFALGASSPAAAAPSQDDQLALQILDAITRGDFQAAATGFDSQMKQKLTPQDLSSSWTTYQQAYGTYQSHGDPQDVAVGALTVVSIPLQMQTQPGEFRVTFHPDQTVAGLFLLKAGTPVS